MVGFGDFSPLCHQVPSYPWCNLFYHQLQGQGVLEGMSTPSFPPSSFLTTHFRLISFPNAVSDVHAHAGSSTPNPAPVGINPECGIPYLNSMLADGSSKSLGNIAQVRTYHTAQPSYLH
jgi:hypothetical protein